MSEKTSSGASAFMAFGCFLVAYGLAPEENASDVGRFYGYALAGVAAYCGISLGIQSIRAAEARPSPWKSAGGRIAWALRPRSWMIAWLAIFAAIAVWGTPHLAVEYPPRACTYAGLKGLVRPANTGNCPWWRWL